MEVIGEAIPGPAGEGGPGQPARGRMLRTAHVAADLPDAAERLCAALGPGPFAVVILFVSPLADIDDADPRLLRLLPARPCHRLHHGG